MNPEACRPSRGVSHLLTVSHTPQHYQQHLSHAWRQLSLPSARHSDSIPHSAVSHQCKMLLLTMAVHRAHRSLLS